MCADGPKDLKLTNLEDLSPQLDKARYCNQWFISNVLLVLKLFEPVTLFLTNPMISETPAQLRHFCS